MSGREVVEAFRAYLRAHNQPVTAQRLAVAEVVLSSDRHLSAEDVAVELATRGDPAATATIYRTLELLVKSGLAMERDFGEGFRRYEASRDSPHHEHLVCVVCGRVVEFREERLDRMTTLIAEEHGFARRRHRLVIFGVCVECREQPGWDRRPPEPDGGQGSDAPPAA